MQLSVALSIYDKSVVHSNGTISDIEEKLHLGMTIGPESRAVAMQDVLSGRWDGQ